MSVNILNLAQVFALGLILGVVYCVMLWYALGRLRLSQRSVFGLLGSAVPRLGLILAAFYWVMDNRWERLLVCLAGFLVTRYVVQFWLKYADLRQSKASLSQG